jgi:hypothetical protein
MTNLWSDVQTCRDAEEIFSKQREDGSWCSGGSWALKPPYLQKSKTGGYDPESPKYVTAIWVLPLLGDMGFTADDQRIRKACEYILSYKDAVNPFHSILAGRMVWIQERYELKSSRGRQHLPTAFLSLAWFLILCVQSE